MFGYYPYYMDSGYILVIIAAIFSAPLIVRQAVFAPLEQRGISPCSYP